MFPGYFGTTDLSPASVCYHVGGTLDRVRHVLAEQIHRCFRYVCECDVGALECPDCAERADNATEAFLARLPEVKRLLGTDVQAAYEGDPAATSPDETILCYPGIMAITNHRLAHELYRLEVPLLSRMIAEHAHSLTGIDIHPGATIAESFFIDHGTGVVVGETSVLGKNVRLYQGVTLGAKSFPLDADGNPIKGIPRHPILEDEVVIYAGATVLGRITIGKGSVIGGNVWLTKDVPANSRISQTTPQPTVESSAK
ncbi:MAG: serine acetyltransferase [Deltaproteobacteria bacterium]|nr:serine acetyltransferase [Deltaproteobacteria bacterium]